MNCAPPHSRVEFANTLRGVAALIVLIFHYMGVFWLQREDVAYYTHLRSLTEAEFPTPSFVSALHYFGIINWGALGVGLFFLISGFVIPFSLQSRSVFEFAIGRIWRLVPTYVIGFTITIMALAIAAVIAGNMWPYNAIDLVVHYVPGLRDHFRTRNIDGIIWTLEVEIKFYIIAAFAARSIRFGQKGLITLPCGIAASAYLYCGHLDYFENNWPRVDFFLRPFMLYGHYIIFIFLGVFINLHYRQLATLRFTALSVGSCLALFTALWSSFSDPVSLKAFNGYLASIGLFIVCYVYRARFERRRITTFLADISYPLYVIHAVSGYLLLTGFLRIGLSPELSLTFTTSVAILVAYTIHVFIERPSSGQTLVNWTTSNLRSALVRMKI